MTVGQAVKDMIGDRGVLLTGKFGSPLEAEKLLRNLLKVTEDFQRKTNGAPVIRNVLNAEQVWARFESSNHRFTGMSQREVRTICSHVDLAIRQEVIEALIESPAPLSNKFNLFGFVAAYFHHWRDFECAEAAETLIFNALKASRKTRRSHFLDVWHERKYLFSLNASTKAAEIVVSRHHTVHQVCLDFFVEPTSRLADAIRQQAVTIATNQFQAKCKKMDPESAIGEFRWIVEDLMTPSLNGDAYRAGMSKLIDSASADGSESFRKTLVTQIQGDERLGDPRLVRNQPNWRAMSETAREKYLAWLAVGTLQFFFDAIVPKNDENRRRADFWLRYAQRPGVIKDFQVALSDDDMYRLRQAKQTVPSYSRVYGGNTSAFLMVFQAEQVQYVIIEFSETGNAAYIYERSQFETGHNTLRSRDFHLTNDLKRMAKAKFRILHNGDWETRAGWDLSDIGIYK